MKQNESEELVVEMQIRSNEYWILDKFINKILNRNEIIKAMDNKL